MPEKRLPIPKLGDGETPLGHVETMPIPDQPTPANPAGPVLSHGPQFRELIRPFPPALVHKPPQGKYGEYVEHADVVQAALRIVGPFTVRITNIIRGLAPAVGNYPSREDAIVGCTLALTATIDGQTNTVEDAGDVENPAMNHDGFNLKLAVSDALKRVWSRNGLGLHLWADHYWLEQQVEKDAR